MKAAGLEVILLRGSLERSATHFVEGSIDDFISAAIKLGENVIFIHDIRFSDEDFHFESDTVIGDEYESPTIDLRTQSKTLLQFESYIGQTHFLWLAIFFKNQTLSYLHYPEWVDDFNSAYDMTASKFEAERVELEERFERERSEIELATQQRELKLVKLLDNFVSDSKFGTLRTQKAMQEYVLAKYPELEELSPPRLKEEVSILNARVQAKKRL